MSSKSTIPVSNTVTITSDATGYMSTVPVTMATSYSAAGIGGATGTYNYYPSGSVLTTNGSNGTSWVGPSITSTTSSSGIKVVGDAEFDGNVKIKGKNLVEFMETLEKRLAILQPDPKKLEKFEALKKAYNHYKMLEALCMDEDNEQST